jgi:hypothetical protein
MDPWEVAQAQVATKYDPQQNAIQRSLDQAKLNTGTNEQAIQGYGTTGRNIIGDTYNKLYQWLDYGKAQQQQDLGAAQAATNAGYDTAIQNIQGYQQQSRNYLNDMARALGQEGVGLQKNAELENLVNTQLGTANAARANYGGSLNDWVARMGAIADMGISSAHQGEAQGRTDFETTLLSMLGQNKLAGTTQETDLMNKLTDIMGLRQSDLIAMYNELAQAEWERQFQQAQLDAQAQQANADLAYKYAALNESASESAANRAASSKSDDLAWAKFNADQAQQSWQNQFNQRGQDWEQRAQPQDFTDFAKTAASQGAFNTTDPETGQPNGFDSEKFNAAMTLGQEGIDRLSIQRELDKLNTTPSAPSGGGGNFLSSLWNWGTRNTGGDPWGTKQNVNSVFSWWPLS